MENELNQAIALHQQGRLDEAYEMYIAINQHEPTNADVLHLLAILSAQRTELDQAKQFIDRAIKLNPASATYHNSLGNIEKKRNNIENALSAYLTAVQIEPNLASAQNNLAILYQQQGKLALAEQCFQQAIAALPTYTDAHFNYARLLYEQQDITAAKNQLLTTIELEAQHAPSLALLGKIHYDQADYSKASSYYLRANRAQANNPDTMLNHAACLMKLDQLPAAITILNKVLAIDPENSESLHNLGAIYLNQQKPKEALKYYLQQLTIKPDADAFYNTGVIYMYQNRYNDAIVYLERALELNPNDQKTLINLATTYLKKEDYPQATNYYQQVLTNDPDNTEIRYILSAINQEETPASAPTDYIQHLFDQYAPYYEQHLSEYLQYQVPTHIEQYLDAALTGRFAELTILDVGCGTGLTGKRVKKFAKNLIGSDLSEKMIEQAKKNNIYDQLEVADVADSIQHHQNLNLIIAADVFSYIGDLSEIFKVATQQLSDDGLFIFTIEAYAGQQNYCLQKTARYAHNLNYIKELAAANHFIIKSADSVVLRYNKKQPVHGYLIALAISHYSGEAASTK